MKLFRMLMLALFGSAIFFACSTGTKSGDKENGEKKNPAPMLTMLTLLLLSGQLISTQPGLE